MKWPLLLVTTLGLVAQRRMDLTQPPWDAVMVAMRTHGDVEAQHALETTARTATLQPWERAFAWRWAGQLAARDGRMRDARVDYLHARDADPGDREARMATLNLGEIAMQEHHWYEAERWLVQVERDSDPIVHVYVTARLDAVRERTRRLTFRYGSMAWLTLMAVLFAWRLARRVRRPGVWRSFGYALLPAEGVAIVGTQLVQRWFTQLAQSGWMLSAVPSALVTAMLWATRSPDAPVWKRGGVIVLWLASVAAAFYLALDFTWWSVERPLW